MCVNFVETHEIRIVGRGQIKCATRARNAMHFAKGSHHAGQVFNGLAGNHDVEGVVRKGQALRISLNERTKGRATIGRELGTGSVQRGRRKIATCYASASIHEFPNETTATTSNLQNS